MKMGFIGLGKMGKPTALNFLHRNIELLVHSATTEAYEEFRERDAFPMGSVADIHAADIIYFCLPDAKLSATSCSGQSRHLNKVSSKPDATQSASGR